MPEHPVSYDGVEVVDDDWLGLTCRIGSAARVFVGNAVPLEGTTVRGKGDCGRLVLPHWFAEQQGLPLEREFNDHELEQWFTKSVLKVIWVREHAGMHPNDRAAQAALERAEAEMSAAMELRARRLGSPRG